MYPPWAVKSRPKRSRNPESRFTAVHVALGVLKWKSTPGWQKCNNFWQVQYCTCVFFTVHLVQRRFRYNCNECNRGHHGAGCKDCNPWRSVLFLLITQRLYRKSTHQIAGRLSFAIVSSKPTDTAKQHFYSVEEDAAYVRNHQIYISHSIFREIFPYVSFNASSCAYIFCFANVYSCQKQGVSELGIRF